MAKVYLDDLGWLNLLFLGLSQWDYNLLLKEHMQTVEEH